MNIFTSDFNVGIKYFYLLYTPKCHADIEQIKTRRRQT